MTAPVREESTDTAGYMWCRHRRFGCDKEWVYRTFADEPRVRAARDQHELACIHRPRSIGSWR